LRVVFRHASPSEARCAYELGDPPTPEPLTARAQAARPLNSGRAAQVLGALSLGTAQWARHPPTARWRTDCSRRFAAQAM